MDGRGLSQLREGIEKAAEAVLGDETEALRRAREELQNLSKELNDEVQRNDPNRQGQAGSPQEGQPQQAQPTAESGQQQAGEQPSDQQKAGKGQNGQANGEKG